jgi:hypothetical protein
MRARLLVSVCAASALGLGCAEAAVKKVSYPEVKVQLVDAFQPDAGFETLRKAFVDAVAKKDSNALFGLIGPTFVWTLQGGATDQFDMGRDALHNFKVVFGFRAPGKDEDGGVDNGPFWDALAAFANDGTYYKATDTGSLVCGPIAADIADDKVYENARKKVETEEDPAEWYFTIADASLTKAPGDTGPPVGKVGKIAMPATNSHPPVKEGQAPVPATHVELLMPNGKTGWLPVAAVRPLSAERLCYAKTAQGAWKIVAYDQAD